MADADAVRRRQLSAASRNGCGRAGPARVPPGRLCGRNPQLRFRQLAFCGRHREAKRTSRPVRASDPAIRIADRRVRGPARPVVALTNYPGGSAPRPRGLFHDVREGEPRFCGTADPLGGTGELLRGMADPLGGTRELLRGTRDPLGGAIGQLRVRLPRRRGADPTLCGRASHQRGGARTIRGAIRRGPVAPPQRRNADVRFPGAYETLRVEGPRLRGLTANPAARSPPPSASLPPPRCRRAPRPGA